MKIISLQGILLYFVILFSINALGQNKTERNLELIDRNWSFAFGHLYDTDKDFGHGKNRLWRWTSRTGF
jgi:beta-galactosidase